MSSDGFVVKNFLRIPKTNVLIVNTYFEETADSSIVYYIDLASKSRETIAIFKPDFVVLHMDYIPELNQLLLINYEKTILADPYTLKSIKSIVVPTTSYGYMIPESSYAVLVCTEFQILILDVVQFQVILTMDTRKYDKSLNKYQYSSKAYKFNCSNDKIIIFVSTLNNIISWTFDETNLTATFNGIITESMSFQLINFMINIFSFQIGIHDTDYYIQFAKHPTEDIIFMAKKYYQIISFKVNSFEDHSFSPMMDITLFDGEQKTDSFIKTLELIFLEDGDQQIPVLFLGDQLQIIRVDLEIDLQNQIISAPSSSNPQTFEREHSYQFYVLKESNQILVSSSHYVTSYNYLTNTAQANLYFHGDFFSRKFVWYDSNSKKEYLITIKQQEIIFNERNKMGVYKRYPNKFSQVILQYYDNLFRVKNCDVCIFAKLRNKTETSVEDFISTIDLFPYDSKEKIFSLKKTFGFNWDLLNTHLDPFKYNDTIWVVVGFPRKEKFSKNKVPDSLFYLINTKTQSYQKLKANDTQLNSRNTNFAVVSFEDKNNPEIIGIDSFGTIYVWDLASENHQLKDQFDFSICLNSEVGELFVYKDKRKLILVCNDFIVYSVDMNKDNHAYESIRKLSSIPYALRAFSSANIIVIGDKTIGETSIYKYDAEYDLFQHVLTISPGIIKDIILWIELLQNNVIWLQFKTSSLFYNLGECLDDSALCTQCTQPYYFNSNYEQNAERGGSFGEGTVDTPFTSSRNIFIGMLKAQQYKELIQGVTQMKVDLFISPKNLMYLEEEYLSFDFTPIILINFMSDDKENLAQISFLNKFTLENYYSVSFENIKIHYLQNECGLILKNIYSGAYINNIQQISDFSSDINCQSIKLDQTTLHIKKYEIQSQSFADSQFIIRSINTKNITIENFTLSNCELGENFTILEQETNVEVDIKVLRLKDNTCIKNLNENSNSSSLFTAGLYKVNDVEITGNVFCNKNIFTTISSYKHPYQKFEFNNVVVKDNVFQSQTTYIFFSALYSMISKQSHELRMYNIKFTNNKLEQKFSNQLQTSSFVQTNKIAIQQFDKIYLENHSNIEFSLLEFGKEITINDHYCINDDDYLQSLDDKITYGCIKINESIKVVINTIKIIKKKANDNPLFVMLNYQEKNASLDINNGEFKDLILNQSLRNSQASPIMVGSNNEITLTMTNCHFENINLQNTKYSFTHSTTALWVENYIGKVIIKDSQFINCHSDSKHNFMYIQSDFFSLDNITFQKSSFTFKEADDSKRPLFNQIGGMINSKVNTLQISNSKFSQSTALKGSFVFVQSFDKVLKIDIKNATFSEGYSLEDGGAFFIDTEGSQLEFNCEQCYFKNIYTMSNKGSAIGFEQLKQNFLLNYLFSIF